MEEACISYSWRLTSKLLFINWQVAFFLCIWGKSVQYKDQSHNTYYWYMPSLYWSWPKNEHIYLISVSLCLQVAFHNLFHTPKSSEHAEKYEKIERKFSLKETETNFPIRLTYEYCSVLLFQHFPYLLSWSHLKKKKKKVIMNTWGLKKSLKSTALFAVKEKCLTPL